MGRHGDGNHWACDEDALRRLFRHTTPLLRLLGLLSTLGFTRRRVYPIQHGHALDVSRLGKEVEAAEALNLVPGADPRLLRVSTEREARREEGAR